MYALLGTRLTPQKYKVLKKYKTIALWLDPDRAGQEAVGKIGAELTGKQHRVWVISSRNDPGSCSRNEARRAITRRTPWSGIRALEVE